MAAPSSGPALSPSLPPRWDFGAGVPKASPSCKNAAFTLSATVSSPPCELVVVFMICALLEGIPNVAEGRMGADAGGHFPRAHAGAHPDEVYLHQSVRVSVALPVGIVSTVSVPPATPPPFLGVCFLSDLSSPTSRVL